MHDESNDEILVRDRHSSIQIPNQKHLSKISMKHQAKDNSSISRDIPVISESD